MMVKNLSRACCATKIIVVWEPSVFNNPLYIVAIDVMFEQSSYSVQETDGMIEVCVNGSQVMLERTVEFVVSTAEATAFESSDFVFTNSVLSFELPPFHTCINITIVSGDPVENAETFFVLLMSDDAGVNIQTPNVTVTIIDQSLVRVSFVNDSFEVTEGEEIPICALILDPIDRDVNITLNVEDDNGKFITMKHVP